MSYAGLPDAGWRAEHTHLSSDEGHSGKQQVHLSGGIGANVAQTEVHIALSSCSFQMCCIGLMTMGATQAPLLQLSLCG